MSRRRRNKGMPHTPGSPPQRRGQAPAAHGSGHAHRGRTADPSPTPAGDGLRPSLISPSHCKGKGRGGGTLCHPHAPDPVLRPRFWETVPLDEMTASEWEALCDGCGKCCLLKLEDADSGRVHYTDVACRLYDCKTRSCGQYMLRRMFVPGCVVLSPDTIVEAAGWMPASCAYRRLHEGRGLADWHPLVSGDPASVERAGQALTWPTVPEYEVAEEDLEDHVLDRDLLEDDGETP